MLEMFVYDRIEPMDILRSVGLFVLAGIFELGGAYLVWLWLRGGRSIFLGLAGVAVLAAYGIIHTLQPSNYGRIQAAYSGFFIVLALIWGWQVTRSLPIDSTSSAPPLHSLAFR